ncbi:hypothetical protein [Rhizobium mesoamericanum]|uniref:Uncharacterized protein n=1 Tax=Rhizobium mesoamericanum STM3625 TaxID=1211777 RepID=K0PKW7_9HYPH|nr:hypothetical protein [Rhizobium mesoamericanum]CCM77096.1 hypothetical protein BN77_4142 [Rhizobium mesoamericanum STM3625]
MLHIDRQTKTIDGVTFTNTHSGQKRAYGDSYYEYHVVSERPSSDVEAVCSEHVYKAIPHAEWQADYRQPGCSMEKAFRPHYEFRPLGDGKYRYVVTLLYAD